jgi:hypothetical protein
MSRKVVLISIFGGLYDHFFNPPPSPFMKGGRKKEILPFSKGELEGICTIF